MTATKIVHKKKDSVDSKMSIEMNYNDKKYSYYHAKFENIQERQPILQRNARPVYASSFITISRDRRIYQENVRCPSFKNYRNLSTRSQLRASTIRSIKRRSKRTQLLRSDMLNSTGQGTFSFSLATISIMANSSEQSPTYDVKD